MAWYTVCVDGWGGKKKSEVSVKGLEIDRLIWFLHPLIDLICKILIESVF